MSFINASEGWVSEAVTGNNILEHTSDGGSTWTTLYQYTGTDYLFRNVFFTDSQNGYLATTGTKYYKTSDGGITWVEKSIPNVGVYFKFLFADPMNGWLLNKKNIYQTSDGGTTWVSTYHSETDLYDIEYADSGKIFARGFYGFLVRGTSDYPLNVPQQSPAKLNCRIVPNPFSSVATIEFDLIQASTVSIKIFSIDGKEMMTIVEENFSGGDHEIELKSEGLGAGIYFLQFKTATETVIKKIVAE